MLGEDLAMSPGDSVLVIWTMGSSPEDLKSLTEIVQAKVTNTGHVQVENADRLVMAALPAGSRDVALTGLIPPMTTCNSTVILTELARVLKPGGRLVIQEPVHPTHPSLRSREKLASAIKLAGFVDPQELTAVETSAAIEGSQVVRTQAQKPAYEIGSSSALKLSFAPKQAPAVDEKVSAVWSLSTGDILDDDVDIMNSDDLLDENDLKKPDPASLRVECDKTKKKKACKNCSCGLAEELAADTNGPTKQRAPTSSCGSCYLGDAFRCSTCPYLGMPAFKSGEKIQLSNRQLNADQ